MKESLEQIQKNIENLTNSGVELSSSDKANLAIIIGNTLFDHKSELDQIEPADLKIVLNNLDADNFSKILIGYFSTKPPQPPKRKTGIITSIRDSLSRAPTKSPDINMNFLDTLIDHALEKTREKMAEETSKFNKIVTKAARDFKRTNNISLSHEDSVIQFNEAIESGMRELNHENGSNYKLLTNLISNVYVSKDHAAIQKLDEKLKAYGDKLELLHEVFKFEEIINIPLNAMGNTSLSPTSFSKMMRGVKTASPDAVEDTILHNDLIIKYQLGNQEEHTKEDFELLHAYANNLKPGTNSDLAWKKNIESILIKYTDVYICKLADEGNLINLMDAIDKAYSTPCYQKFHHDIEKDECKSNYIKRSIKNTENVGAFFDSIDEDKNKPEDQQKIKNHSDITREFILELTKPMIFEDQKHQNMVNATIEHYVNKERIQQSIYPDDAFKIVSDNLEKNPDLSFHIYESSSLFEKDNGVQFNKNVVEMIAKLPPPPDPLVYKLLIDINQIPHEEPYIENKQIYLEHFINHANPKLLNNILDEDFKEPEIRQVISRLSSHENIGKLNLRNFTKVLEDLKEIDKTTDIPKVLQLYFQNREIPKGQEGAHILREELTLLAKEVEDPEKIKLITKTILYSQSTNPDARKTFLETHLPEGKAIAQLSRNILDLTTSKSNFNKAKKEANLSQMAKHLFTKIRFGQEKTEKLVKQKQEQRSELINQRVEDFIKMSREQQARSTRKYSVTTASSDSSSIDLSQISRKSGRIV